MTGTINLLPWRAERYRRRWRYSLLALAASMLFGLSIWWSVDSRMAARIQMQRQHNAVLEQKLAELQTLLETRQQHAQELHTLNQARACLEHRHLSVLRLFNLLVQSIPDGIVLSALQQQGQTLSLQGRTESASDLAAWLQRLQAQGAGVPTLTELESANRHTASVDRFEATLTADSGTPCQTNAEAMS